jgi:hypothetical protein
MQKKDIKVGQDYAWSTGGRDYPHTERVRVVSLEHEFEEALPRRFGFKQEYRTVKAVQIVRVGEDLQPVGEPFRLRNSRHLFWTWDEEVKRLERVVKDRAARREQEAAAEKENTRTWEVLLHLVGQETLGRYVPVGSSRRLSLTAHELHQIVAAAVERERERS